MQSNAAKVKTTKTVEKTLKAKHAPIDLKHTWSRSDKRKAYQEG